MALPFDQHVVHDDRAAEMREMYAESEPNRLLAVDVEVDR